MVLCPHSCAQYVQYIVPHSRTLCLLVLSDDAHEDQTLVKQSLVSAYKSYVVDKLKVELQEI
jgi:hypothetical protein